MNTQTMPREALKPPRPAPASQLPAVAEPLPAPVQTAPVVRYAEQPAYPSKIVKALLAITSAVGAIEKRGWNTFQQYHYQKWEDVLAKLSPLLTDNGLLIQQTELDCTISNSDALISIVYEFTIIHADGDVWPERPRWRAISRLRDGKGVYDDKAANKCHTQAHKYFLLHLFKIRTADIDDADAGTNGKGNGAGPTTERKPPNPNDRAKGPHALPTDPSTTFDSWSTAFIGKIKAAATIAEVEEWEKTNGRSIDILQDRSPQHFGKVRDALNERYDALRTLDRDGGDGPTDQDGVIWTEDAEIPADSPGLGRSDQSRAVEANRTALRDTLTREIDNLVTMPGCLKWATESATRLALLSSTDRAAVDAAFLAKQGTLVNGARRPPRA